MNKVFPFLLSPIGQIDRLPFFAGWAVTFVGFIALVLVPVMNLIALIVTNYMVFCLLSKRLNHIGLPGAVASIPYPLFIALVCVAILDGLSNYSGGGFHTNYNDELIKLVIAMFVFNFIVGLVPGNRFGHH